MGWLEMHRNITDWQNNLIIPTICVGTWDWFITNAKLAGLINVNKCAANWTPPRREMIDPVKETSGITNMVRSGLRTPSEAIREQGYDFDEVIKEYASDLKKLDALGIVLDIDMRAQINSTEPVVKVPGGK